MNECIKFVASNWSIDPEFSVMNDRLWPVSGPWFHLNVIKSQGKIWIEELDKDSKEDGLVCWRNEVDCGCSLFLCGDQVTSRQEGTRL